MQKLFVELDKSNISYVVWKDIYKVNLFFEGNGELDLLVNFCQKKEFEEIVFSKGFIPLDVVKSLRKEKINHYIKYKQGKYFHLHIYFDLITGNHYVKEYHFPLAKTLFECFILHGNMKIANREVELAFLIIRLIIKKSFFFSTIKEKEKKRLCEISKSIDESAVIILIQRIAPKIDVAYNQLLAVASNEKIGARTEWKIRKQFDTYKKLSGIFFVFAYIEARINLLLLRIKKRSNKTIRNKGVAFALLGSDGSGKTTIASKVYKQYSAKTSCRKFYLGGNSKTYSILTKLSYLNYYFTRVLSPIKDKFYLAWLLYYCSFATLEMGKARDRKNKIEKGNKLKRKGWIVIYERFPIVHLFDFPNKLLKLKSHPWFSKKLSRCLRILIHKIEQVIKGLEKPDASFIIITDLDKMKERRVLAYNELIDIDKKLKAQKEYLLENKANLIVLENNGEIDSVIDLINQEINKKICTYNS